MMVQNKALHILIATAFVFVNLVCPCASVAANAQPEEQAHHQHHEAPADSDCPHQQCPDCNSAVAISSDQGALANLSPRLTKVDLDCDDAQTDSVLQDESHRPLLSFCTGPPGAFIALAADSPVHRHDLQLE